LSLSPNSGTEAIDQYLYNNVSISSPDISVKVTYDNNGVPGSKGYMDYISIRSKRNLQGYGKQFRFQFNQAPFLSGIAEYQISSAASINQVWDITDIYNPNKVTNNSTKHFKFQINIR